MRKNKMMRVAGVLLIAVLLTTCVISGTFAKYVTTGGYDESARVAKFGVTIAAEGSLFDKTYLAATDNTPGGETADGEKDGVADAILTVESENDQVVAPGTQNDDGLTVTVAGTPEVDVQVALTVDATDIFLKGGKRYPDMTTAAVGDDFKVNDEYHPIKFTLTQNGTEVVTDGTLADVAAKLESFAKRYDANTNLSTAIGALKLTWKWDFEDGADREDTLLGDLAAGTAEAVDAKAYSTKVAVDIAVSVTQID